MTRILRALLTNFINAIARFLPDDIVSDRVRPILYRALKLKAGPRTLMKGGSRVNGFHLTLDSKVFVNRECYFDLSAPITLGDNVVVGHHVTFVTADHDIGTARRRAGDVRPRPIVVGDGAWIGCRSVVLPGVTLGAGCVIGAGSVVTRDVPDHTVVAGVPAKTLRVLPAD